MTEPTQRRVVCAAERHEPTEIVFCGARHGDATTVLQILAAQFPIEQMLSRCFEQGFIDQFGVFMTREEALEREIKEWSEVLADYSHPVHHLAARVLKVLEAELHFTNTGKFPNQ